jgi:UDP-N-acetyl-D-glucosamine dehydrogenase
MKGERVYMNALDLAEQQDAASNTCLELEERIRTKRAAVGVVGLGYVGLPLALTFSEAGFSVTGLDTDQERIGALRGGRSYITDIADTQVSAAVAQQHFTPTSDLDAIRELDTIIICVPTPLRKTKDPDLSFVLSATEAIAQRLRRGQLVILESTTYPGTTEELVLPRLLETGLRAGEDFFLAFSPERVDPGNKNFTTKKIPKVVGGISPHCTRLARLLYGQCIEQVHAVSSPRVAETVKLLENTFRSVNIALANEFALFCTHAGIDVWEVIRAASTKPFGFTPFFPGPGLGGHCIPVDPMYLLWKARADGFDLRFIDLADKINGNMPKVVTIRAMELLNEQGKAFKGARVHIVGVAYKRDIGDIRESPALEVIRLAMAAGAEITYSDPFVPAITVAGRKLMAQPLEREVLEKCDLAVILTDHSAFDYECVVTHAPLVFDTRNATDGRRTGNVVRL